MRRLRARSGDPGAGALPRSHRRPRPRRSWPQRLVIGGNVLVAGACLATAGGLQYAYGKLGDVRRVAVAPGVLAPQPVRTATTIAGEANPPPPAENYLIYGTDNRSCIDPGSPWAPAYLTGYEGADSQRTDSIMVLRVDPAARSSAILSFPRDLYVPLSGTTRRDRINGAIDGGPERLVQTITDNFGVPIHHFVAVDFCAFRNLVDAVGGVSVPFEHPVRDEHTGLGLVVPIEPGCHRMGGDEALAYARSRYYEYFDETSGRWREDTSSDLGRIKRQQDLVKRLLHRAIDQGARNPAVLNRLVDAGLRHVVLDEILTPRDIKDLGDAMRSFDPEQVQTYTIEADRRIVDRKDVLVPRKGSAYNEAVSMIFQGTAVAVPEEPGAPDDAAPDDETTPTTARATTGTTSDGDTTTTSLEPVVVPTTEAASLTPPPDLSCR